MRESRGSPEMANSGVRVTVQTWAAALGAVRS